MINIIIGFLLMIIGIWGVASNWYSFVDLLYSFGPFALTVFGIIALVAGIKTIGRGQEKEG